MSRIGRRRRSFDRNYPFPFFFLFPHPPEGQAAAAAAAPADPVESAPSWTHLIFRLLLLLPPTRCLLLVAEEYELIPFCLVADETKLFLISPCMVCTYFFFVRSLGIQSRRRRRRRRGILSLSLSLSLSLCSFLVTFCAMDSERGMVTLKQPNCVRISRVRACSTHRTIVEEEDDPRLRVPTHFSSLLLLCFVCLCEFCGIRVYRSSSFCLWFQQERVRGVSVVCVSRCRSRSRRLGSVSSKQTSLWKIVVAEFSWCEAWELKIMEPDAGMAQESEEEQQQQQQQQEQQQQAMQGQEPEQEQAQAQGLQSPSSSPPPPVAAVAAAGVSSSQAQQQHHQNQQQHHHQQLLQGGGGGATAGPRPAPAYRVVNTICEKREDGPGPRCGHTLTAVATVGEEGSPGYVGPRLILFGGATALEGNTGPVSPQGTPGGAGISMCTHTQTHTYPSLILCSVFLAPLVGFLHQFWDLDQDPLCLVAIQNCWGGFCATTYILVVAAVAVDFDDGWTDFELP